MIKRAKKQPSKSSLKKSNTSKKAVVRRAAKASKRVTVTAPESQALRNVADKIGKLISLEGYRSSFSLKTIAKDKGLLKYLPSKQNKKEAFYEFLKNLYKEKPRTIKIIVREILPKAIEKRHTKGDPVLQEEALELVQALKAIKVDLKNEILALHLPTHRPTIIPPPVQIQKILDALPLHPRLLPDCKTMFVDGHINESVRKALERYEKIIQDLTGLHSKIGSDLMANAFNETNPLIKFNALITSQDKNKQIGIKYVSMGLMTWWRNNLSHGDEIQMSHLDAIGRLMMISNLFYELDNRIV